MPDLKINKVSDDILESLTIIAKQKGYKSRDAFLRDELQKVVQRYWKKDGTDIEQILLSKTLKIIEMNSDVMAALIREQNVQNPFQLSEYEDDSSQ
ncbi:MULTISPECIES: hypothetical protein [Listeria]|uniref:hypothetical protein n=1 Tax=Listeria TaxID=1637 RepID=UPI000B597924|nr:MULTISPECIES: hypothetical protein [Listeria]